MSFLGISGVYLTREPVERPEFYCFKKGDNLYVSVPKSIFDNDLITQTFVSTVFNSIYSDIPINEFYRNDFLET